MINLSVNGCAVVPKADVLENVLDHWAAAGAGPDVVRVINLGLPDDPTAYPRAGPRQRRTSSVYRCRSGLDRLTIVTTTDRHRAGRSPGL